MKLITKVIIPIIFLASCSSYNSLDSFYNSHKNDNNVVAVQVPRFLFSSLRNINPELDAIFSGVSSIRYIQLQPNTVNESNALNREINNITATNFVDVFRKNKKNKRTLFSIREKKDIIKEIIYYNNKGTKNSVLYLSGNFNPIQVRRLANSGKFENLVNSLENPAKWNSTTSPISY